MSTENESERNSALPERLFVPLIVPEREPTRAELELELEDAREKVAAYEDLVTDADETLGDVSAAISEAIDALDFGDDDDRQAALAALWNADGILAALLHTLRRGF